MFPSISSVSKTGPITQILVGAMRDPRNNFGPMAAPPIPVPQQAGKLVRIVPESALRDIAKQRAPGDDVERFLLQFSQLSYETKNQSIGTIIPREIYASRVPSLDLDEIGGNAVATVLHTRWMREIASFFVSGSWVAASADYEMTPDPKWDTSTGVPIDNIGFGRKKVRGRADVDPNTLLIGASAYESLLTNPQIVARLGQQQARIVDENLLKQIFKVEEIVVCKANYVTTNLGQATQTYAPIIDKSAILAYIEQVPNPKKPSASALHTLFWDVTMNDVDGTPSLDNAFNIEPPRWDDNKKCWVFDGETNFVVKQCNPNSAYLFLAVCS